MDLLHELLDATASVRPDAPSITDRSQTLTYARLAQDVEAAANGFLEHGLHRGDRVAVWLPKLFAGHGDCLKVDWTFLGLAIPNMSLIAFLLLSAVALLAVRRAWLRLR